MPGERFAESSDGTAAARPLPRARLGRRAIGRIAREDRNRYAWNEACTRLDGLLHGVQRDLHGPQWAPDLDDLTVDQIAGWLLDELDVLRRSVIEADQESGHRHREEADGFRDRIAEIVSVVTAQAQRQEDAAKRRLVGMYRARIEPLDARIGEWLSGLQQAEGVEVVLPRSRPPGRAD